MSETIESKPIEYTADVRFVRIKDDLHHWEIPVHLRRFISAIYSVFAYDNNKAVHCCELTPSFECHFIEHTYDSKVTNIPEEIREQISDLLMEGDSYMDNVAYYHCHHFNPEKHPENFHEYGKVTYNSKDHDGDTEEELMQCAIEEALEYARCNSVF